MSGSVRKRLKSAHTYDALVLLAYSSDNEDVLEHLNQIEKDLLETFPGDFFLFIPCCPCENTVLTKLLRDRQPLVSIDKGDISRTA